MGLLQNGEKSFANFSELKLSFQCALERKADAGFPGIWSLAAISDCGSESLQVDGGWVMKT